MQAADGDHVNLDCTATPRAAIDSQLQRRHVLAVEPPSRHPIHSITEHLDPVTGIPGGNQHSIAALKVALSHLFQRCRLCDSGSQIVGGGIHVNPHKHAAPWNLVMSTEPAPESANTSLCRTGSLVSPPVRPTCQRPASCIHSPGSNAFPLTGWRNEPTRIKPKWRPLSAH